MTQTIRRVAVIGGVRIPFCRSNTLYADLTNLDMLTASLNGLVDRYNLKGVHIDEVVGGSVVTHSRDWNIAREAVISTRLAASTPGITMMQACGTSLQAAAGIVADSVPESEWQETENKARALIRAAELAQAGLDHIQPV